MFRLNKYDVWASEIAGFLNAKLTGEDFLLSGPRSINIIRTGENARCGTTRMGSDIQGDRTDILIITDIEKPQVNCRGYIVTKQPEVDLAQVLREFFAGSIAHEIHPTALISDTSRIGRNVAVGPYTVIGPDVEVQDNTIIMTSVVINGSARIGRNCVVKDGAVIGSEGYGFVEDKNGAMHHVPQLGTVVIGDKVWVGANSTIERGMTADTFIEDDVKIDDLVHVGNGSRIGKKTMLTTGTVVSHSVDIGERVTISPNVVIRECLKIADEITVGQGSVVISDLNVRGVYVGNPARLLTE